ncbi:anti-sigma factor family protein [Paenibacillus alvei]|uniref:Anti-sigma-W factor RsiW n=1 Tax=Paenibacillus alvei TaxID=44250 RepID=A0A383RF71_PAEAL|nr:zf-HC2 domain-containing protein [Paenibacillus alvei]SYX84999.1 conserved protein of unknown function [Paenibacillus alvei]
MKCLTFDQFMAYLDSELSSTESSAFEEHIHACADCRKQLAVLKQEWEALDALGEDVPQVSDSFTANVMGKIAALKLDIVEPIEPIESIDVAEQACSMNKLDDSDNSLGQITTEFSSSAASEQALPVSVERTEAAPSASRRLRSKWPRRATIALACVILLTAISATMSDVFKSVVEVYLNKTNVEMTVEDLDPAIVRKAEEAIKMVAANKDMKLYGVAERTGRTGTRIVSTTRAPNLNEDLKQLAMTARDATVRINNEGMVQWVSVLAEHASIDETYLKTMQTFLSQQADYYGSGKVKEFGYDFDTEEYHFIGQDFKIKINKNTGAVTDAFIPHMKVSEVDERIVAAAKQALKQFAGEKPKILNMPVVLTNARHSMQMPPYVEKDIWDVMDEMGYYVITIGAKTGKVWSISDGSRLPSSKTDMEKQFDKPIYTKETAITAIGEKVKGLFGIDLEEYELQHKLNEYTFVKPGKPSVKGSVNEKGEFWGLEVIPEDGVWN